MSFTALHLFQPIFAGNWLQGVEIHTAVMFTTTQTLHLHGAPDILGPYWPETITTPGEQFNILSWAPGTTKRLRTQTRGSKMICLWFIGQIKPHSTLLLNRTWGV